MDGLNPASLLNHIGRESSCPRPALFPARGTKKIQFKSFIRLIFIFKLLIKRWSEHRINLIQACYDLMFTPNDPDFICL